MGSGLFQEDGATPAIQMIGDTCGTNSLLRLLGRHSIPRRHVTQYGGAFCWSCAPQRQWIRNTGPRLGHLSKRKHPVQPCPIQTDLKGVHLLRYDLWLYEPHQPFEDTNLVPNMTHMADVSSGFPLKKEQLLQDCPGE